MRERLSPLTLLTADFKQNKIAPSLTILSIVFILCLSTNSFATDGWQKSEPAGTRSASDIDAYVIQNNAAIDLALSYLRQGCVLSYSSTSSLSIGAGSIVVSNSDGSVRLMLAKTSAISTNWNVAENGLDTGSEAASTTYYVYAIASAVTDTAYTIKVTTNSSAPSSVTYYKRLGSFYNDSSSNITYAITNDDNYYGKSLGSWVSKSTDTVYQATTDGFVCACRAAATQADLTGLTNASNPPTTQVAIDGNIPNTEGDKRRPGSITFPVKKGDYWKVVNATTSVYWIPLE